MSSAVWSEARRERGKCARARRRRARKGHRRNAAGPGEHVEAILDDDTRRHGSTILGVPITGAISPGATNGRRVVVGIGDNRVRRDVVANLAATWITAVHPSAVVHPSVRIGAGAVVFAGAVIQPDVTIGAQGVVNTGACVDHDCQIGDFAQLGPNAALAGNVTVGEGAFVGTGASVIPGIRFGAWTMVGAGAAVARDIAPGVVAVGVPAQVRGPR